MSLTNGLLSGICTGKNSIADFLVKYHSFSQLTLRVRTDNAHEKSMTNGLYKRARSTEVSSSAKCNSIFETVSDLVDFVTSKWQQHWVMTDINEDFLAAIIRRPFFLLVSVDAPIFVRWSRLRTR